MICGAFENVLKYSCLPLIFPESFKSKNLTEANEFAARGRK